MVEATIILKFDPSNIVKMFLISPSSLYMQILARPLIHFTAGITIKPQNFHKNAHRFKVECCLFRLYFIIMQKLHEEGAPSLCMLTTLVTRTVCVMSFLFFHTHFAYN